MGPMIIDETLWGDGTHCPGQSADPPYRRIRGNQFDPGARAPGCQPAAGAGQWSVGELTYKEFELLQLLMRNHGIVVPRDTIMERVWKENFEGESRTIDMHIKSLRQKLGDAGKIIRTVRNVGYRAEWKDENETQN